MIIERYEINALLYSFHLLRIYFILFVQQRKIMALLSDFFKDALSATISYIIRIN